MSDKGSERVLVVPTAVFHRLGVFQGFNSQVDHYLPELLDPVNLRYLPRSLAETDPTFKQLIPYVVFRWQDQVFHYTRGSGGGEARLRALRSLGVGGHICSEDGAESPDAYGAGMRRELAEEVFIDGSFTEKAIGLINDDANAVGQVHLGIVHLVELDQPRVRQREEVLTHSRFSPLADLRPLWEEFETWSRFLLQDGRLNGS
jgi:predicted NUDIX family phosphoesterase